VPAENGFGPNNHQSRLPLLPDFSRDTQKESIRWSDLGTATLRWKTAFVGEERDFPERLVHDGEDQKDHPNKTGYAFNMSPESVSAPLLKINPL